MDPSKWDDLYADPSLPKAFYHPTVPKNVDNIKLKTRISADTIPDDQEQLLQAQYDREFLKGGHYYRNKFGTDRELDGNFTRAGDTSSRFDESWPVSERPSMVSVPDLDESLQNTMAQISKYRADTIGLKTAPADIVDPASRKGYSFQMPERDGPGAACKEKKASTEESSTLAKYIERFRHGQPKSRTEREKDKSKDGNDSDFWWLNRTRGGVSDLSSTTALEESERDRAIYRKLRNREKDHDKENTRTHMSLGEYMRSGKGIQLDDNLRQLQEKADRVLEKTTSSANSSEPIVSTEGLGSTASTLSSARDTPRTVEEQPYRPNFTKTEFHPKLLNTEDDILIQWRRRRKMEVMKQADPVIGAAAKNADRELETKLASFRKRLQVTLKDVGNTPDYNGQPPSSVSTEQMRESGNERLFEERYASQTASLPNTVVGVEREDNKPPSPHSRPTQIRSAEVMFTPTPKKQAPLQVDTECQTSPMPSARKQTEQISVPITTCHKHSPIASPNLPHRTITNTRNNGNNSENINNSGGGFVEPHMHLSCDIIPCPVVGHSQEFHQNFSSRQRHDDEDDYNDDNHRRKHSKRDEDEKNKRKQLRRDDNSNSNNSRYKSKAGSNQQSNRKDQYYSGSKTGSDHQYVDDSDSSFERMKIKHLKSLQVEYNLKGNYENRGSSNDRIVDKVLKEPNRKKGAGVKMSSSFDSETEDSHFDNYDRPAIPATKASMGHNRGKGATDKHRKDESGCSLKKPPRKEKDAEGDSERVLSHAPKQRKGLNKQHLPNNTATTPPKAYRQQELSDEDSLTDVTGLDPSKLSFVRDASPESDQRRQGSSKSQNNGKSAPKVKSYTTQPPQPKKSMEESSDKLPRTSRSVVSDKVKRAGIGPKHSSPMPSINSAIGQVVGEHMFMSSVSFAASSVASSINSLHPQPVNVTINEQPEPQEEQSTDALAELFSDEEEFTDDEILQDLRHRRREFLKQLTELDALIKVKDDE